MTTPAKVAANRSDAWLSTGPRTPQGKSAVARKAISHGIFAHVPVVPGENPYDWDQHRAGIVDAIAPVGLLEVNLAERVAMLLWQLARLARYQTSSITANIEDAGLLPVGVDPVVALIHPPTPNPEGYQKLTNQRLRIARSNHAELLATADILRHLEEVGRTNILRTELVVALLGWAYGETFDYPFRRFDPEFYLDPGFLPRIGVAGAVVREIAWTPELLSRALDYYAGAVDGTAAEFRTHLQHTIDNRVAALAREVTRLEADACALVRRSENGRARAADAALLPPEHVADQMMKTERHLNSMLNSTLHELERLKVRRLGAPVIPPMVADIQLTLLQGLG